MLLSMMLFLAAAGSPAAQVTHKIKIDGALYRVTVKGEDYEVARKSLITTMSTAERDRMFKALEKVTGCKSFRDWMAANVLMGKLDCQNKP